MSALPLPFFSTPKRKHMWLSQTIRNKIASVWRWYKEPIEEAFDGYIWVVISGFVGIVSTGILIYDLYGMFAFEEQNIVIALISDIFLVIIAFAFTSAAFISAVHIRKMERRFRS